MNRHKAISLFFLWIPLLLAAQEDERIVVTGTKTEQRAEESVEAVEVVRQEDIRRMGAENLADVLRNVQGVSLQTQPVERVSMQGLSGAYVKVLVEGVEVNGDFAGATPLSQIPVSDIERIEIIRGASSVLYGSDAMGGVINIITKKNRKDPHFFSISQDFRSNLRVSGNLEAGFNAGAFYGDVNAGYDYDDGKTEEKRDNLGQEINYFLVPENLLGSARANIGWKGGRGQANFHGLWTLHRDEYSISNESGMANEDLRYDLGAKGSWETGDYSGLDGFASWKYYRSESEKLNYVFDTAVSDEDTFRDFEQELRYVNETLLSHQFLIGQNYKYESLEGESFEGKRRYAHYAALFLQDSWNAGGGDVFRVVGGLRLDLTPPVTDDQDFHYKATPKLSLRWDAAENLVLRLSYGMGYKTPSLKQKHWRFFHPAPANFMLLGNPNLKPETSHGFNGSGEYRFPSGWTLTAGGYFNYLFDMITTVIEDENPGTWGDRNYIYIRRYENKNEAYTAGIDTSLSFRGEVWGTSLSYSWLLAKYRDEESEKFRDLSNRVPHQWKASLSHRGKRWKTEKSLSVRWDAPQLHDEEEKLFSPDYLTADFRVEQPFFDGALKVHAGVENMLNNFHFVDGSEGESQKEYFGLHDGLLFSTGVTYSY